MSKKKLTKKMAKEIFQRIIGSVREDNIENLSDQTRNKYGMSIAMIKAYCFYETAWDFVTGRRSEGDHIKVCVEFDGSGNESVFYIDPVTLEIDVEYTEKKIKESRKREIMDYLEDRGLVLVSESDVEHSGIRRACV